VNEVAGDLDKVAPERRVVLSEIASRITQLLDGVGGVGIVAGAWYPVGKPRQAGAMRRQVLERDVGGNVCRVGETLAHGPVQFEPPIFDQLCQRYGREYFGDRTDFVDSKTIRRRFAAEALDVLAAILDETFSAKPMAYWQEVLSNARVTFGVVQSPADVTRDPQLFENEMIVPIQGAGGNLTFTISSPMQVHDVTKVPARRAPEIGEHNEEVLRELGFDAKEIDGLRASGAIAQV